MLCKSGAADEVPGGTAHATDAARGGIQHSGEHGGPGPSMGTLDYARGITLGVAVGREGSEELAW